MFLDKVNTADGQKQAAAVRNASSDPQTYRARLPINHETGGQDALVLDSLTVVVTVICGMSTYC